MIEQAGVAGGYFLVHRFVVGAAQCPHIGGNGVPAQLLVAQVGLKFFQCGSVELVEVNNLASAEFAESVMKRIPLKFISSQIPGIFRRWRNKKRIYLQNKLYRKLCGFNKSN